MLMMVPDECYLRSIWLWGVEIMVAMSFDGIRYMKYLTTSDADDGGTLKEDAIDFT